jgi:eukaryotic-like serine/threonine-protein kinase
VVDKRSTLDSVTLETSQSVLRSSALASGLVSQQQLDDAVASLSDTKSHVLPVTPQVTDDQLAQRLVELGYLNRWQAEQLKEGRTKFTLGPYRIVNTIGQGGMGHVFKAEHKLLGRIEAIKVLPKSKSTPDAVAAFQREMRAQAQLDHPNLVRVSYADFEGETYFFVTEYVPGTDLRKLVRRNGPIPFQIAATIVSQAAEGLHYAHRRGLVHRDVKPGNLLVTPDGRTKITDLGLAWFLMDELAGGQPAARAGSLVGTADYLAPESIRHPDKILPVSDVYSLGCTLYYAVTGKVPFPGGSTAEKIRRHLGETPLNPLHFNPDLTEGFCDAIAAMMHKDPHKRTPTAAAVVELLGPWRDDDAAKHLAELRASGPANKARAGMTARPSTPHGLDETASFVLDDAEIASGPVESPSQVSQGTVPLAGELDDTLSGVHSPHRAGRRSRSRPAERIHSRSWRKAAIGAVLAAAAAAALAAARFAALL